MPSYFVYLTTFAIINNCFSNGTNSTDVVLLAVLAVSLKEKTMFHCMQLQ